MQNKCQMRFLDKLVLKQNVDHKLMINMITCSMLEFSSTYDYNEMENDVFVSTLLEPTTKHLMTETSLGRRASCNLVSRGQNMRAEIYIMENVSLK